MINTLDLLISVIVLFAMIIPGFLLRKAKLAGDDLPAGLSNIILYVAQPALIIVSFIRPYDKDVIRTVLGVLTFSFIIHGVFFALALLFFRKTDEMKRRVYRFGSIFANAGYMGIPLITALFGADAAIYATVYIIGFNFYCWSLGCLLYSGDKSFVSVKKIFLNPATIPTYIGLIFFLSPLDKYIPAPPINIMNMLSALIAPLSMMLIGMRLADMKLKGAFNDKDLFLAIALKLLIFPAVAWGIVRVTAFIGIFSDQMTISVVLICTCTPCATVTAMFAEKFNGDRILASKFVSLSTLFSLITMPLVALLLNF